jgi:hypothetical protein
LPISGFISSTKFDDQSQNFPKKLNLRKKPILANFGFFGKFGFFDFLNFFWAFLANLGFFGHFGLFFLVFLENFGFYVAYI